MIIQVNLNLIGFCDNFFDKIHHTIQSCIPYDQCFVVRYCSNYLTLQRNSFIYEPLGIDTYYTISCSIYQY